MKKNLFLSSVLFMFSVNCLMAKTETSSKLQNINSKSTSTYNNLSSTNPLSFLRNGIAPISNDSQNTKPIFSNSSNIISNSNRLSSNIDINYDIPYIIKYSKKQLNKYKANNIATSINNLAKNVVTKSSKYMNTSFKKYANALREEHSQTIKLIKDNTYLYPLLLKYIGVNNIRKDTSSSIYGLLYELKIIPNTDYTLSVLFPKYLQELGIANSKDVSVIMNFVFGGKSNIVLREINLK